MAFISQETVQKVLDETDIVDLIQGYFPLKRAGVNYLALCPFHNEKTPSFNVNPSRQIFHCFGCQAGGDAIKFVMLYENLPFPEAAKHLASRAGITLQEEVYDPKAAAAQRQRGDLKRLQRTAADWFHRLLFKSPEAQAARDYLKSRGLGMETARQWKFGYAPSNQRLFFDWAKSEGFSHEQLVGGGLAKWSDENYPGRGAYSFFRHRLMFPVNDAMGEPIAFSGRVLSPDQRGGKYVNSPETPLFNKSKTFFGFDRSKRPIIRDKRAVVLEGQLDLIAAFEGGIENVVAPLGTAFTEDHARALKRVTDEVVLCFDSDTAGLNAAAKAFRLLAPNGILVRLALLPDGEDPDSLIRSQGAEALRGILESAPEFFDFQIDRRGSSLTQGSLRDRINFAKDLAADIALVEDKMLQDSLISRVTVRLGVGEDEIRKLVRGAVATRLNAEKSKLRRSAASARRDQSASTEDATEPSGEGGSPSYPSQASVPSGDGEIRNRSIRLLCKALLTDPATRSALVARPLPDFLDRLTETELLAWLWRSDFDPARPSSVNAFLNTLPPAEHHTAVQLINAESVSLTPALADECLRALKKQSIQNQIAVLESRLGAPGLALEGILTLNKELLDLRSQLREC